MMASFMSYFAPRKDPKQSARDAIVSLRAQLAMIEKKEEYLAKNIEEDLKKAKANVVTNKAGTCAGLAACDMPFTALRSGDDGAQAQEPEREGARAGQRHPHATRDADTYPGGGQPERRNHARDEEGLGRSQSHPRQYVCHISLAVPPYSAHGTRQERRPGQRGNGSGQRATTGGGRDFRCHISTCGRADGRGEYADT